MFNLFRRMRLAVGIMDALDRSTAVVHLDLSGHVIKANNRFGDLFGVSPQELVGLQHAQLCTPEYVQSSEYKEFWTRLRAGESFSGLFQRRRKDGRLIWLRATYNPVLNESGRPTRIVKLATDVTEQTETRQQSEAVLSAIDRSMATIEFDLDGHVLRANDNFLQSMGYRREEVIGKHHRIFCAREYSASAQYAVFWSDLADGRFYQGQVERVTRQGRKIWLEASYNPIRAQDGRITGVVKLATDITSKVLQGQARQEGVDKAYQVAILTKDVSQQGLQSVQQTVSRIDAISDAFNESGRRVVELGQHTSGIDDMINAVRRVAEQTNLLALNASVEAARAGESGRGFAVVATEVRQLAANSKAVTDDISKTIASIKSEVDALASNLQEGLLLVDEGVSLVAKVARSMDSIQVDADEVVKAVEELRSAH